MADNYSGANIATRQGEGEANVMQWGNTDKAVNQIYQEQQKREARGYNDYLQGQQALQKEFANVRSADMPDVIKGYQDLKQTKQQMLFDNKIKNNPLLLAQKQQEANIKEAQLRQLIAGSNQMKEEDKAVNQRGLVNPSEFEDGGLALHAQHMNLPYNQRIAQGLVGADPYLYKGADLPKLETAVKIAKGTPTLVPTGEQVPIDKEGLETNHLQVLRANKPSTVIDQTTNSFLTNKGEHGASYLVNKLDPAIIKSYTDKFDAIPDDKYKTLWGEDKQAVKDRIANAKTDAQRYSAFVGLQHAVDNLPTYGEPKKVTDPIVEKRLQNAEWDRRNKITNQQTINHIALNKAAQGDTYDYLDKSAKVLKTGNPDLINQQLSAWKAQSKPDSKGGLIGFSNANVLPDGKVEINYSIPFKKDGITIGMPQKQVLDPNDPQILPKITALHQQFLGSDTKAEKQVQKNIGNVAPPKVTPTPNKPFLKPHAGDGITINRKVKDDNWTVSKNIEGASHENDGVDVNVNGKPVNAEGGELKITNGNEHDAIIPKTLRQRVLAFLKIGDNKSITKIVEGLPKQPNIAADGGDYNGDDKDKIVAPANYKQPLSVQTRNDWNDFLDYLDKKGVAGSKELDRGNGELGLAHLAQYQKENPKTSITPETIAQVQYEQAMLRKGDKFGSFTPKELEQYRNYDKQVSPAYWNRPVSPVDNILGSVTSKSFFPRNTMTFSDGRKPIDFGADIEGYYRAKHK